MNIHEYQAKEIFKRYNVPTPNGYVAFSVEEAVENATEADFESGGRTARQNAQSYYSV
jgi:succinyl-CoA synthetase beta subunit